MYILEIFTFIKWLFPCANSSECIDVRRRCDGYSDCKDRYVKFLKSLTRCSEGGGEGPSPPPPFLYAYAIEPPNKLLVPPPLHFTTLL